MDLGDANDLLSEQVSLRLSPAPVISPSSQVIKSGIIWGQAGSCAAPDVNCLFEKFLVSIINNFLPDGVGGGGDWPHAQPPTWRARVFC